MSPQNPWVRLVVGIFCTAIAIQLVVDAIRPLVPYLLFVAFVAGVAWVVRWWRNDQW